MKYAQQTGIAATLILIAVCFLPWSYIESRQITISGFAAEGTHFGRPGLVHFVLGIICLALFTIPRIWAKRGNVFIAAINLAWAIRNYILVSACLMGECPQKKPALYVLLLMAVIIQGMALFPRISLPKK